MKIAHIHVWDKKNKGDVGIVLAVQELLRTVFPKANIIDFPLDKFKKIPPEIFSQINKTDLVVIGGGGIYYRWFTPFDISNFKKIDPPIILFGVGLIQEIGSRPLSKKAVDSIVLLNKLAKLTSVRDLKTRSFLVKNGVNREKINVIGDPAVFLKEKKAKYPLHPSKINIGFNLNYSGWLGFGKYKEEIIKNYQETLRFFQEEYDADIYYLMHHPDERKILKEINIKNVTVVDLPPGEQKYVYGKLSFMIGMMLHSVVFSFGATTSFVNVGYDLRNKSFTDYIGFPELLIPSDKLDNGKLLKKSMEVFSERKHYRSSFSTKKKEIWESHNNFLKQIKGLF